MTEQEQIELVNKIALEVADVLHANIEDEMPAGDMIAIWMSSLSQVLTRLYFRTVPRSKQRVLMEGFIQSVADGLRIYIESCLDGQEEKTNG